MLVVADSSPLVALAAAGALDLLDRLFDEVRIPPAVESELLIPGKPHTPALQEYLQGKVLPINLALYVITGPGLGQGELEAMALYKAISADQLLVDDQRARKVARLNGIEVVGSMGVILLAKRSGMITAIKPLISQMRSAGIHLSETRTRRTPTRGRVGAARATWKLIDPPAPRPYLLRRSVAALPLDPRPPCRSDFDRSRSPQPPPSCSPCRRARRTGSWWSIRRCRVPMPHGSASG